MQNWTGVVSDDKDNSAAGVDVAAVEAKSLVFALIFGSEPFFLLRQLKMKFLLYLL